MKNIVILSKFIAIKWLLLLLTSSLALISCGDKQETEKKESGLSNSSLPTYDNWEKYQLQLIDIIYPANHPQKNSVKDLAAVYWSTYNSDCRLLNIPAPQKRITVCFYTGPGQGQEMTGEIWPNVAGDTIHHWPPIQFGLALMEYLIPNWSNHESQYPFVKYGLMKLMDGAGRNYHQYLFDYIDSTRYIPLSELAVYPDFNPKGERYQSALAASFVDFIVFKYGIEKLKELYLSTEPFDKAVQRIFKLDVNALETQWHITVRQALPK